MSVEFDPDPALRRRFIIAAILMGVLAFTNAGLGHAFRDSSSGSRDDGADALAQENAEIETHLAETRTIFAEVEKMRKETSELNAQAAKLEAGSGSPRDKSK